MKAIKLKEQLLAVARTLAFIKLTPQQEEDMIALLLQRAAEYKEVQV